MSQTPYYSHAASLSFAAPDCVAKLVAAEATVARYRQDESSIRVELCKKKRNNEQKSINRMHAQGAAVTKKAALPMLQASR